MCYFLTVAVPEGKADILQTRIPRNVHVDAVANKSLLSQLPVGFCTFVLTRGGCSCDLYSEMTTQDVRRRHDALEARLRRKYEKKGWSATKIQRAFTEASDHVQPIDAVPAGLDAAVQRLIGELAKDVGGVALLVHFYDGPVDSEDIAVRKRTVVPSSVLLASQLSLGIDEIVTVRAQ